MPDDYTDFGPSSLVTQDSPAYDPPMQIPEGVDWRVVQAVTGMMDRQREQQEKARQQAVRYRGQQEFRRLVASGMKPEMALREVAVDLFDDDPRGMASVLETQKTTRNIRTVAGVGAVEFLPDGSSKIIQASVPQPRQAPIRVGGPNKDFFSFDSSGVATQRTTNSPPVKPDRFVASQTDSNTGLTIKLTEDDLRKKQLIDPLLEENKNLKGTFYTTDPEKKKIAENLAKIESIRGKTGKVKVKKDGREFWLPNSQLDEALKQGYEQAQ